MNTGVLKLYRNAPLYNTHAEAIEAIKTLELADGQPALARYKTTDGENNEIVRTIFMIGFVDEDGTKSKTLFDLEDTEKAVADIQERIEELGNDITTNIQDQIDELKGQVVTSITKEGDVLTVVDADAANTELALKYASNMPDELTTPNAVGGVAKGLTAGSLKDKTYGQIIDMILFPELNPTVVAPSASISLKSPFTNNGIYEVGATAPTTSDFTTGLNRGTGTVAGQTTKNRAGELIASESFVYYGGSPSNTTLPTVVALGSMKYNYHAAYKEGDVLVTSYGNKASSVTPNPLPKGAVNSSEVVIYGTYPYFCNGASAKTGVSDVETVFPSAPADGTKLPLQKWTDALIGAKFAPESETGVRLTFDFPATKNVTKVEFMNTVSGKWEVFGSDKYTIANTSNKTIQGASVVYKRLTTTGSLAGALQLRFTVANA